MEKIIVKLVQVTFVFVLVLAACLGGQYLGKANPVPKSEEQLLIEEVEKMEGELNQKEQEYQDLITTHD